LMLATINPFSIFSFGTTASEEPCCGLKDGV